MTATHSDALVFFGATGDLAYKKIFPSLQAMVKHGGLEVPVIGVAKAGFSSDSSGPEPAGVEKHGGLEPAAFDKLCGLLRYVDGDQRFRHVRRHSPGARRSRAARPLLAIPPALFGVVAERLSQRQAARGEGARVVIEAVRPRSRVGPGSQCRRA
jgi:glucose-6-phosphate 1-dehydrogenase